jgi:hypothetical protein
MDEQSAEETRLRSPMPSFGRDLSYVLIAAA